MSKNQRTSADVKFGLYKFHWTWVAGIRYQTSFVRFTSFSGNRKMYTNPFARTHCTIRQVIDKFLNIDNKNKKSKDGLRRTYSNSSSVSSSSSMGSSWKNNSSSSKMDRRFWIEWQPPQVIEKKWKVIEKYNVKIVNPWRCCKTRKLLRCWPIYEFWSVLPICMYWEVELSSIIDCFGIEKSIFVKRDKTVLLWKS